MPRLILAIAVVLASTNVSFADDPPQKLKVTLVSILASEEGSSVDRRLEQIAEEVQRRFPQLKSFKIQSLTTRELAVRERSPFELIDGKVAEVMIKHGVDGDRVSVAVTAPGQKEVVYRTVCGKFVPIMSEYQTPGRERLILALRVEAPSK